MTLFNNNSDTQENIFDKYNYNQIIEEREETRNKKIEEEKKWVSSIVPENLVDQWKQKGAMSPIEVFNRKQKHELIPYMGTWKQGTKMLDIKNISNKLQTGQNITPEEREKFQNFVLDLAEVQTRGYSFLGGVTNLGLETIPFMAEFTIGLLTSGGTASVGAVSSKLTDMAIKKNLTRKIGEGVAKTAYNATLNPKTYAFTATRLPQQVRLRFGDLMVSDSLAITPEGQAILSDAEQKPAIAFLKSLALTNIEVASELSGEILVRPVFEASHKLAKVLGSPIVKMLPENFADKFVELAEKITKLPFLKAVDKLGWNGVLEEMGEERVGNLLKFAFNLDEEKGYSFEQLLDAMFPSVQDLGTEAVAFAATGLGMNAIHTGLSKVSQTYTKDGFLIDAGIFRVHGYDSYLDKKVKEQLSNMGKQEEEIAEAVHFASREDKIQFLKNTKTEFDTKKEYDEKEFEKDLKQQEIEDKTFDKLIKAGVQQDIAFSNAKIFGQFFRKYGSDNIKAFDDWYNKFDVQYNVPINNVINQFQLANTNSFANQNIQENFGQSVEDLQNNFKEDIKNILQDNGIGYDEFEIEDVRLYGSYTTGKNKDTSDLDVIVQYTGSMKEDTAFNILNDTKLTITDVNGVEREIDINPINREVSGTIDEHINYMQQMDNAFFQSANTAGANANKIADAQKEWKEKGTDSKYFKKWFGDSKVVDENGEPLIVYHGTLENFSKFDKNTIGNRYSYDERGFFFTSSKNIADDYATSEFDSTRKGTVMPVYISAQKPLVIDQKFVKKEGMGGIFNQEDSISFWDNYQDFILETFDNGNYDAIIIDDGSSKMVVAFEPEQIKSVDNQGTFDVNNPNIYFQSENNIKITPIHIEKGAIPNFKKVSQLKKWIEEELNLLGEVRIKENNKTVQFSKSSISRSLKGISRNNVKKQSYSKLKELVENAVFTGNKEVDQRHKERNKGQEIYHNAFAYNGNVYGIEIAFDVPKSENSLCSYAGHKIKIIKTPEINEVSSKEGLLDLTGANISINDIRKLFKSKLIKQYNNDYNKPRILFQGAYHGTPHRFDKFSLDAIGTGEGNQLHGYGLYFAGNKNVSENYRKGLVDSSKSTKYNYDGKPIEETKFKDIDVDTLSFIDSLGYEQTIEELKNDIQYAIKWGEDNKGKQRQEILDGNTKYLIKKQKELELVKELQAEKLVMTEGQLYKVDIPEDDVLLDEQKSFSEQSENVKNSLAELLLDEKFKDYFEDFGSSQEFVSVEIEDWQMGYSGGDIYNRLSNLLGSDKEASLLLNKYGIKGITYDGQQDGRCYVIFDDNAVNILKTYYQENDESLIAGFTYPEVMDKLIGLYDKIENSDLSQEEINKLLAKAHILEDAFEVAEGSDKFKNPDKNHKIMLNAYYIMNNQEIPQEDIDLDSKSQRSYKDLLDIHNKKKETAETTYYGYFSENQDKNIITIMSNSNASTALHELGHLFLNGLTELAKASKDARIQLDKVNEWLGSNGEYTIEQQEKFARSFEAYLYKGKAPNNYLKEVFHNFKEWLKSVYHHITDLENRGADISPEVQKLFDDIFGDDTYYQERKEANNLLSKIKINARRDKLEKIPVRDEKSLTEGQKRCKNVCYEILSIATGKDINYLKRIFETNSNKNGYARRREVVEELVENADDKITTSVGMKEEWKEFFSDTGVSHDNDQIDGDYNLAQKALWTIVNKDYWDSSTLERNINNRVDDEALFYEQTIDNANKEYKILIQAYKNGNRNIALSAVYDWIESLPSQVREDYENKFIFDSAMIERNEHINKFDKAKEKILSKALELENQYSINKNEQYKEIVKEIIKSLSFLQPLDKAKLTANILDIQSTSMLMASIDNILDIAKTMEDFNYRRNLERKIYNELKTTKNIKKNGRTVGKYDYRTNKIFEELRQIDKYSAEKADEIRLESQRFASAEDNGLSRKDKLINKFLTYKAFGRKFEDTELMKDIYEEIINLKLIGKSAKSEQDFNDKVSEEKDIDELINILENKKEGGFLIKNYISIMGNLETILNAIFNADIKEKYGAEILYAETQAQAWQYEQKQKFEQEVAKIYNLPKFLWDKKIIEYLSEKHTFVELRRKYDVDGNVLKVRSINRTLSKMDIIQAYIWAKNEILAKRLVNQFGEETLESMFELLSKEDEKLALLMMKTAQSFYPLVNKAFIDKYGLDLPKVSCYYPSTPERGSEVDLYNDYSSKALGNGFTKSRATSEILPMDFHNPITTLYSHIDGVSKFVFMSNALDKANLRFRNNDLKRAIINKYGEDAYRCLEQSLLNVTYKKEAVVFNGMNKILDNLIGNWIQANVAVKPIVGLKQLLSANNYAMDMPYMDWQMGFLDALSHPQETIDYMMNIPYIKARFGGSYSNEFLKQTIENSKFALSKKLKDCCNLFIRLGDIGAIVFGGKPYIDYLIKERGMTEEQAIKKFILSTNRSQQSSAISSLSNFQVNMTRNPLGKLFIAFKNSPQQYVRKCGDAIISVANGDMTKEQCAKELFQYLYLQPFLYAMATSGSLLTLILSGDDDDLLNDLKLSIFNLNANAIPLLGDIWLYVINRLAFKEKGIPQVTPLQGDIMKEINRISKDDVELKDYLSAFGYIIGHVGLGYNTKAITDIGSGVGDVFTGEITQGAMKILGYTDKRSKHIAGND